MLSRCADRRFLRTKPITAVATLPLWAGLFLHSCNLTEPSEVDAAPPEVAGTVAPIAGYPVYAPGETLHVSVTATDNQGLAYFGYSLGGPAGVLDTIAVLGRTASRSVSVVVRPEWAGLVPVTALAWDAYGRTVSTLVDTVTVIPASRRPMVSLLLPAEAYDVAWDSVRNRVYLTLPSANQVAVLDLATQSLLPPIALSGRPLGLDLTVGGDSLVVALRQLQSLAFVNLTSGVVDTANLGIASSEGPVNLRVLANQKVVVTIGFDGSGAGGSVRKFDLVTRNDQGLAGVGFGGSVARSRDRQQLLLLDNTACCQFSTRIYSSATDSFGPPNSTTDYFLATVSVDRHGSRFLVGPSVFDPTLRLLVTLDPPGYYYGATVLTSDGSAAFMGGYRSYIRASIPTSVVQDRVLVPLTPERLLLSPDEGTLLVLTTDPRTSEHVLWLIPQ